MKQYVCELASNVIKNWQDVNYDMFCHLANQLTNSYDTLATGLFLWSKICPNEKEKISEQTYNLIKQLFIVVAKALVDQNNEVRMAALQLFDSLVWHLKDSNEVEKDPSFMEILKNVSESIIQLAQEIFKTTEVTPELREFVKIFTEIYEAEIQFYTNVSGLIELAFMAISSEQIPVHVKICIHSLVTHGFMTLTNREEILFSILNCSIELTVQACCISRMDDSYMFSEELFIKALEFSCGKDTHQVFDFFNNKINDLVQLNEIPHRQVALFLIKIISEKMTIEQAKNFMFYSIQISDIPDEALINTCCHTLNEIIYNKPDAVIYLMNQLPLFLLKYANIPACLNTLVLVIKASKQPPQYLQRFIEILISLLPEASLAQASWIIECISTCFSEVYVPSEEFFPKICEILFSAANLHDDFRPTILRCFKKLVPACPSGIIQNLNNIFQICAVSMSSYIDESFSAAVLCIKRIVSYLPNTVAPHLSEIMKPMLTMITMEMPNIDEMEIERNRNIFKKNKCNSLRCLCTITQETKILINQIPQFLWENVLSSSSSDHESNMDHSRHNSQLLNSSKVVIAGARLFIECGFDMNEILNPLLNNLQNSDNKKELIYVLAAIKNIVLFSPPEKIIDPKTSDKIGSVLTYASTGIYTGFIKNESSIIPPNLCRAIFSTFIAFIDKCKNVLANKIPDYYRQLYYNFFEFENIQSSQTVHIFAKLFYYCGDNDYVIQLFNLLLEEINKIQQNSYIDYEIFTHAFISLAWLYKTSKEKLATTAENVVSYIVSHLGNAPIQYPMFKISCQTLYSALMVEYNSPIDEFALNVINEIDLPRNSESFQIIGEFLLYASKEHGQQILQTLIKFSVSLFSSEPFILTFISPQLIEFFSNIIKNISLDDMLHLCYLNEAAFNRIKMNLHMD